jgi:hypothetical protein
MGYWKIYVNEYRLKLEVFQLLETQHKQEDLLYYYLNLALDAMDGRGRRLQSPPVDPLC